MADLSTSLAPLALALSGGTQAALSQVADVEIDSQVQPWAFHWTPSFDSSGQQAPGGGFSFMEWAKPRIRVTLKSGQVIDLAPAGDPVANYFAYAVAGVVELAALASWLLGFSWVAKILAGLGAALAGFGFLKNTGGAPA